MRRGPAFAAAVIGTAGVFAHVACATFDSESPPAPAPDASDDAVATDATTDGLPPDEDATVILPGDDPDAATIVDAAAIPDGGKIAFITKGQIRGGAIGGRLNADTICNNVAHAAGFSGTFAAFLRDATAGAAAHLPGTGTWYRLDGVLLFSSQPSPSVAAGAPLNVNELGLTVIPGARAWTAANGATGREGTCDGWFDMGAGDAVVGSAFDTATWANAGTRACSDVARLYCFQQ